MIAEKYLFRRALRPFSFSVALIVCLTGILAAYKDGYADLLLASLTLIAGFLLQAGVNLINDYSDLSQANLSLSNSAQQQVRRNFNLGLSCFLIATVIGCYLIAQSGLWLLIFALIGLGGALGYTLEPINYKRRGLAVFVVFWLMGILMVSGSYYVLTAQLSLAIVFIAVPVSLLVALLLLSNELRDFEEDSAAQIATLTVRIGFDRSAQLYKGLVAAAALSCISLSLSGYLPYAWLALLALPLALIPVKLLPNPVLQRKPVTPATGRFFLGFGLLYCLALLL